MDTTNASPNAEVQSWFQKHKITLFVAAVLLVSNLGVYFYQRYQMGKLRDQVNENMEAKAQAAERFAQYNHERMAKGLLLPLAWGIRGEMMRGNKEVVDHFLTTVVQETDVDLIAVVDMSGTVYLSTDKKYEGKPVLEVIPTMPREVIKPGVQSANSQKVVAISPIMGDVAQLGILYFESTAEPKFQDMLKALQVNPFAEPKE